MKKMPLKDLVDKYIKRGEWPKLSSELGISYKSLHKKLTGKITLTTPEAIEIGEYLKMSHNDFKELIIENYRINDSVDISHLKDSDKGKVGHLAYCLSMSKGKEDNEGHDTNLGEQS